MPKAKSRTRFSVHRKPRRPPQGLALLPWLRKRLKILGFSLLVVAATTVVFVSLYFYQFLREGLARAGEGPRVLENYGRIDTGHDFNLVIFKIKDFNDPTSLIDSLWVANFQVKNGKLNLLSIDPEEILPAFKNTGKVKIAALYGLSQLGHDDGLVGLSRTLSLALGLPVDGLFYTDEKGFQKLSSIWRGSFEGWSRAWPAVKSFDIFKAFFLLGSAYKTNLTASSFVGFSQYLTFRFPSLVKPFSVGYIYSNPERLSVLLRNNFADSEAQAERLKAIVLNGAGQAGLAGSVGRLLSNLGLNVLSTGNVEEGQLYGDSVLIARSRNYYSVRRLSQILGIKEVRLFDEPGVADNPQLSRFLRGDLILILGRDQVE